MKKLHYVVIIVIVVLLAGVGFYVVNQKRNAKVLSGKDTKQQTQENQSPEDQAASEEDAALTEAYKQLTTQCENGQWVELEAVPGEKKSFTGRFSIDVPFEANSVPAEEEREIFLLNGNKEVVSGKAEVLGFFEGREVEISGVEEQGKIRAEKIRCAGKETNKDVQLLRQEVMDHIAKNLNTLSPQKGEWEIYDIAWPADDHVYVDYATAESEDSESLDENVYSLLLQVTKDGTEIKTTQVAFLKMSENEDEEWDVISGTDKFKDLEDMDYYEYDDELKKWVK